jgi:magnesium-transporting ATPase (P-type)
MVPGMWLSRRFFTVGRRDFANQTIDECWAQAPALLLERIGSTQQGLSSEQAAVRLQNFGPNQLREERRLSRLQVLMRQLASPLLLLLVFAAVISAVAGEVTDAAIVLAILCASVFIGYRREYSAHAAARMQQRGIQARGPGGGGGFRGWGGGGGGMRGGGGGGGRDGGQRGNR